MTNVGSSAQSTLPPHPISSSIITRSNKAANHQSASTVTIECNSTTSTTTTTTTAKTRAQKARALATTSDTSKSQFENNANLEENHKLALNNKKTPPSPQATLVCSPSKKKITSAKSSPDSSESHTSLSNSFNTSPTSSSSNNNNNLVALLPCSSQKLSSELLFSNVGQVDNDNCVALVNNKTSKSLTHYVNDQATENWLSSFKVRLIFNLIFIKQLILRLKSCHYLRIIILRALSSKISQTIVSYRSKKISKFITKTKFALDTFPIDVIVILDFFFKNKLFPDLPQC
jgi:hypothetical protein